MRIKKINKRKIFNYNIKGISIQKQNQTSKEYTLRTNEDKHKHIRNYHINCIQTELMTFDIVWQVVFIK